MAGSEVTASQHPTETTATAATAITEATKAPTEPTIDIDISHPEVKAMVDAAVKEAENQTYTLAPEAYVDVLEEAIQEVHKEMKKKGQNGPVYVYMLRARSQIAVLSLTGRAHACRAAPGTGFNGQNVRIKYIYLHLFAI